MNLHVNCREILAIVGPNGAGKSTLLKAMLGVVPYSGRIFWQIRGEKRSVPASATYRRRSISTGMHPSPLPTSWPPRSAAVPSGSAFPTGQEAHQGTSRAVSAEHLIDKRIGDLSGGELQRVLLCLALTSEPDILLLDEPVSGIDAAGTELFLAIVAKLRDTLDVAILIVTHDLLGIASRANRVLLLNRRVVAEGRPEDILGSLQIRDTFPGRQAARHRPRGKGHDEASLSSNH